MIADVQKLELLRWKFTELGKSLRDLSDKNEEYFNTTMEALQEGFTDVIDVLSEKTDVKEALEAHSAGVQYLSKSYDDFVQQSMSSLNSFNESIKTSSSTFGKVSTRVNELLNSSVLVKTQKKKKPPDIFSKISAWSKKQGITGKVNSFMGKTHIPKPGMLAGGSIMLMLEGFLQEDKLRKEAGEVYNILIESFDLATRKMVQKGADIIASLQTKLYRFYGIAKEEAQAVAKQFVSGGLGAEIFESAGVEFVHEESGSLGNDFVTFSLGLDKMFSLSGGTSAQRMVSYMEDFGLTLEEAKDTTYDLMMAGQSSGIGTMQFAKNVETSAGALKDLGLNINQVIGLASELQDSFEKMGVPKNFAGRQAARGLQAIAQTIGNLSGGLLYFVAEQMTGVTGPEGVYKFQDYVSRIKNGDPDELMKFALKMVESVEKGIGRADAAYVIEGLKQIFPSLGTEGARSMLEIAKKYREGDIAGAKKSAESAEEFKQSFMTERKSQSAFDREMTRISTSMKDVGSAMLGIAMNILSILVSGIEWLKSWFSGGDKAREAAGRKFDSALSGIKGNIGNLWNSLKGAGTGLANLGMDFLNPTGNGALGAAFSGIDSAASAPTTPKSEGASMPQQIVRTVPIWVKPKDTKGGTKKFPVLGNVLDSAGADSTSQGWVGGGLALEFVRVNEIGDIHFNIVGNCPRCGLLFGTNAPGVEKTDSAGKSDKTKNTRRDSDKSLKPSTKRGSAPVQQGEGGLSAKSNVAGPAPWVDKAAAEMGVSELPGSEVNPRISEYFEATRAGKLDESTQWCAAFASWALDQTGQSSPKTAGSGTLMSWGREAESPEYGALAVSKKGHTAIVVGADDDNVYLLGGNQNVVGKDFSGDLNSVGIIATPKENIKTYRMPSDYKSSEADVAALRSNPVLDKWKAENRKKGGSAVIARR